MTKQQDLYNKLSDNIYDSLFGLLNEPVFKDETKSQTLILIDVCISDSGSDEINSRIKNNLKILQSDLIAKLTKKNGLVKESFIKKPDATVQNNSFVVSISLEKFEVTKQESSTKLREYITKQIRKDCFSLGVQLLFLKTTIVSFYKNGGSAVYY